MTTQARIDLIAIASFGGHLEELLELRAAWQGCECLYVTTEAEGSDAIETMLGVPVELVADCHLGQVGRAAVCLRQAFGLVRRHRPRCVVTTGALPGLIMGIAARLAGAQVIWVDSLANTDALSGSGRYGRWIAHRHLTQWPAVAARDGTQYAGSLF